MPTTKVDLIASNPDFVAAVQGGTQLEDLKRDRRFQALGAATTIREAFLTISGMPTLRPTVTAAPPADEWTLPNAQTTFAAPAPAPPPKAPAHGGKWKRFVVCSDVHGDKMDVAANNVMFDFVESHWKPDIRVCAGDLWDFRPLRGGASLEEKAESMRGDYQAGKDWMERFFAPDGEKHFLFGNHDQRLLDLAEYGTGVAKDFAMDKANHITDEFERLKVKTLPYDKRDGVLRLGHLKILHGMHCGVYASRQTALIYGGALFGHTHAIDEHHIPGLERRAARNIGCLCDLNMSYAARMANTLKWAHGFAFGVLNPSNGDYFVWQAEEVDKNWILPTDFVEKQG